MEITWFGHACFRLKTRDCVIVTDPFDKQLGLPLPKPRADIVTVSMDDHRHNFISGVKGEPRIISAPGEYETKMVFITAIALYPPKEMKPKTEVIDRRNVVYLIETEGLTICHLGCMTHIPTQTQVEALSDVNVLIIPVGNAHALNAAQAAEVISLIEPRLVIPMQYKIPGYESKLEPIDKFQKEMGLPHLEKVETLKVLTSNLPEETQVIELIPRLVA